MADKGKKSDEKQIMEASLERGDSFSEFLKDSLAATSVEGKAEVKKAAKLDQQKKKKHLAATIEGADENLGENFEDTPWLPPSIEKAQEFKQRAIYHGGTIRIDSLNIVSAPDIGAGTSLYFQFAMTMSICLFVMSILSLPALVFVYSGTGMKQEDRDAFGFYKYTLGNIGAENYNLPASRCTQGSYAYNDTCIHFDGNELSITDAANVMTAMEFIQIFVFFAGIFYLQQKAFSVSGKTQKSQIAISDYTVVVSNIPHDTKDWQILQHFSDLYALDKVDFKGRPPVALAHPVQNCDNTGNPMHMDTWVAECTLHKGIGEFISAFKDKQYLMEKLYRCRAEMKMYAENSPHAGGHKLDRYRRAEQNMIHTGMLIDQLTEQTIKKKKLKILVNKDTAGDINALKSGSASPARPGTAGGARIDREQQITNPKSIYRNIDAPAVKAYITFQYSESRARCLEDYEKYAHFPYNWFYPQQLMFRGKKIRVHKAAEPDQIVWENLEISTTKKFYMRTRTAVIALVLVIVCFMIILLAAINKNLFASKIPPNAICKETLPTLYINGSKTIDVNDMELVRPPSMSKATLDANCRAVVPGSFYAVYSATGDFSNPITTYDINACTFGTGICPSTGRWAQCPCLTTGSAQVCETNVCKFDNPKLCDFQAGNIGVCYCYGALGQILQSSGVVSTLQKFNEEKDDTSCKKFYQDYSFSVGLSYLAVATTTVSSTFLRTYLKVLTKQEARTSSDDFEGSILVKTFQTSYVLVAVIVLIAYGTAKGLPQFLRVLHIFDGPYDDFSPAWYGNVGFYLMTTFIIQSFSSLVYNLVEHWFIKPVLRYYHHERVKTLTSTKIVMQHDLDMLEVGPIFDSTTHTSQLLTLLFFAMTFAPGMPLMMPLCCFAFALYFRVDKYLLCRYYQRPPQLGDAAIRSVIKQLPYAAIIRLAIGAWMLGNPDIIPAASSSAGYSQSAVLASIRAQAGNSGAAEHLFRDNTFPLFILMLIIVAAKLINWLLEIFPVFWIFRMLVILNNEMSNTKIKNTMVLNSAGEVHPWELIRTGDINRQQQAAFTGDYYRYIKHKDEIPDTFCQMCEYQYLTAMEEAEMEDGWEMRHDGDYVLKMKVWGDVRRNNKKHKSGDVKKTFEVIADHRCSTYNIEKIPAYKVPMQGLREGTLSMMEAQIRAQNEKNVVDAVLFDDANFDAGGLESNVIANYQRRKTNRENGVPMGQPSPYARTAKSGISEEDDEDDEEDYDAAPASHSHDIEHGRPNEKDVKQKPQPVVQQPKKAGRSIAVENTGDSFYFEPTTPVSTAPQHPYAKTSGNSSGAPTPKSGHPSQAGGYTGTSKNGTPHSVNNEPVKASHSNEIHKGKKPFEASAYLGPDPEPVAAAGDGGDAEKHSAYFPKSRSAASASYDDEYGNDHKPYFPGARSADHSGDEGKKKKKKKKDKHRDDAPSSGVPHYPSSHSGYSSSNTNTPHSTAGNAYLYEEDEAAYQEAAGHDDWNDGVGGLV